MVQASMNSIVAPGVAVFELNADGDIRSTYETATARFEHMGLGEDLLRGVCAMGFERPSVIQQRAILPLMSGRSAIAQAPSGTGKTGAFAIGLLQQLDCASKATQAIILAPTQELALQISEVVAALGKFMSVVVHACTAGAPVREGAVALRRDGAHVVVGTPGYVHTLISMGALDVRHLRVCVLDEADLLLSPDWEAGQVHTVLSCEHMPAHVQLAVFSTTLPADTIALTRRLMRDPVCILVQREVLMLQGIQQYCVSVGEMDKLEWLLTLWEPWEDLVIVQAVVFVNSRRQVDLLAEAMRAVGFAVSAIHSELPPEERRDVMREFQRGTSRTLIATDEIARGMDVQQVSLVVNYDIWEGVEQYLHRIGRAGRNGRRGVAISLVSDWEMWQLREVQAYFNTEVQELEDTDADLVIGGGL